MTSRSGFLFPSLLLTICFLWVTVVHASDVVTVPIAKTVESSYPDTTGWRSVNVPAGGSLSTALANASCGTVILLQAGATYAPVTLPNKNCTTKNNGIIIRSNSTACRPAGTTVTPRDQAAFATIRTASNNVPAIQSAANAGTEFYRIGPCLRVTASSSVTMMQGGLIQIGTSDTVVTAQASGYIMDRILVEAPDLAQSSTKWIRAIAVNGNNWALIDSWCWNIKVKGADSQCVESWSGNGPAKIDHNYLEAAGENFMFGGAKNPYFETIPSDIQITRNFIYKPLWWKRDDPSYGGLDYDIKNGGECKVGKRWLYRGNIVTNVWPDAQNGMALLITPRQVPGYASWGCTDLTIAYNKFYNVSGWMNVSGYDSTVSVSNIIGRRAWVHNNYVGRMYGSSASVRGIMVNSFPDFVAEHNTVLTDSALGGRGQWVVNDTATQPILTGLKVRNNIYDAGSYPMFCSGCGPNAEAVLDTSGRIAPDYIFTKNLFINLTGTGLNTTTSWPAYNRVCGTGNENCFPSVRTSVGFTDSARCAAGEVVSCKLATGNYRYAATDGYDLGANTVDLASYIAAAASIPPVMHVSISTIYPTHWPAAFNQTITITGSNFVPGAMAAIAVGGKAGTTQGVAIVCTVQSTSTISCLYRANSYLGTRAEDRNLVLVHGGDHVIYRSIRFD